MLQKKCPKKQQIATESQTLVPEVATLSPQSLTQPQLLLVEETSPSHETCIESPILLPEISTPSQQTIIKEVITTPNTPHKIALEETAESTLLERKRKATPSPSESSLEETVTVKNTSGRSNRGK